MKKNYSKLLLLLIALISSSVIFAQTNRVKITVNWPTTAYENKVEVYDQANFLILTICNNNGPQDCYTDSGSSVFSATYDLGCLSTTKDNLPDYYIKLFSFDGNAWGGSSSSVVVNVGQSDISPGTDVIDDAGDSASTSGYQIDFVVGGDQCQFDDTDLDGVIDLIDIDDDNDGILDTAEGLELNQFNCEVPSLNFLNGFYDSSVSSGAEGTEGAVYRFKNASEEIDVLLHIVELTNCTIDDIDVDEQDTPEFLQSRLNFTGSGTPGVTYEFSLVSDGGGLDDLAEIQRIGGTTWDCDGTEAYQESVRYYNPSAYGLDNPTSLTQDEYFDGAGITAGTETYAGFSTNTILRSYFQFLANKFRIRMQLKKSTDLPRQRLYAMSFTQCDIFEYKAPILTILSGVDTDGDGINNELDLDADGDGIP
ncbi:MAG: hypothetical protein KJN66_03910, partial [Bacteroidia bacterium]|nr:hypothetical protein [Bacteroidia bacterium]